MPIYFGNNKIKPNGIKEAYVGNNKVYSAQLPTVTISCSVSYPSSSYELPDFKWDYYDENGVYRTGVRHASGTFKIQAGTIAKITFSNFQYGSSSSIFQYSYLYVDGSQKKSVTTSGWKDTASYSFNVGTTNHTAAVKDR